MAVSLRSAGLSRLKAAWMRSSRLRRRGREHCALCCLRWLHETFPSDCPRPVAEEFPSAEAAVPDAHRDFQKAAQAGCPQRFVIIVVLHQGSSQRSPTFSGGVPLRVVTEPGTGVDCNALQNGKIVLARIVTWPCPSSRYIGPCWQDLGCCRFAHTLEVMSGF